MGDSMKVLDVVETLLKVITDGHNMGSRELLDLAVHKLSESHGIVDRDEELKAATLTAVKRYFLLSSRLRASVNEEVTL